MGGRGVVPIRIRRLRSGPEFLATNRRSRGGRREKSARGKAEEGRAEDEEGLYRRRHKASDTRQAGDTKRVRGRSHNEWNGSDCRGWGSGCQRPKAWRC